MREQKPVKVSRPVPPRKRSPGPRPVPRRKKQKRDDDSQDTAGEETPDTEDYEDVDEDGTVMVKSRAIKERKVGSQLTPRCGDDDALRLHR